jgi:transcriptional regulator with XRE-family HTH domain
MDTPYTIRTGRDLAAERVRRALRQRDIAAALGVSVRRIGALEWQPRPTGRMIARYLAAIEQARRDR